MYNQNRKKDNDKLLSKNAGTVGLAGAGGEYNPPTNRSRIRLSF